MFELLSNKLNAGPSVTPGEPLNPACTEPPPIPELIDGPMIVTIKSGPKARFVLNNFKGTITDHTGNTKEYISPSYITEWDGPDDGYGYCHLYIRGLVLSFQRPLYTNTGIYNVAQWGTEFIIGSYYAFFASVPTCARITATDAPWFGTHPHGVYGTNMEDFFNRAGDVYYNLNHWDTSNVTSMAGVFYLSQYMTGDIQPLGSMGIPSTWNTDGFDWTHSRDLNGSRDMNLSQFYVAQPQHIKDKWNLN